MSGRYVVYQAREVSVDLSRTSLCPMGTVKHPHERMPKLTQPRVAQLPWHLRAQRYNMHHSHHNQAGQASPCEI